MTNDIGTAPTPVGHFDEAAEHYAGKYYDEADRSFMTVRQARVLEIVDRLGLPEGSSVLDAGCGPGHLVEQLASRGYAVSAMDAAEGMLRQARARAEASAPPIPVSLTLGDIEALPYEDASFDLVCSNGVIEYLAGDSKTLSEMHRVLRPGGYLMLPVTNAWSFVNWLDGPVEFLKRQAWFRHPANRLLRRMGSRPVLPRNFEVRRHSPRRFRASLEAAGFELSAQTYFYFLPWPRPFDQFFPRASAALGERMEPLGTTAFGVVAEGYLTLSVRRPV